MIPINATLVLINLFRNERGALVPRGKILNLTALQARARHYLKNSKYDTEITQLITQTRREIADHDPQLSFDENKVRFAAGLAAILHDTSAKPRRMSGEMYFLHPVGAAQILAEKMHVPAETVMIATLLHDCVEDTALTLVQVEMLFGREVRDLVDGVTKVKAVVANPTAENMDKFIQALKTDPRSLQIKAADRAHNLLHPKPGPAGEASNKRQAEEALAFFVPLLTLTGQMKAARHLADIAFKVFDPSKHEKMKTLIERTRQENQTLIDRVSGEIRAKASAAGIAGVKVEAKSRTPYELYIVEQGTGHLPTSFDDVMMLQVTVPEALPQPKALLDPGDSIDPNQHTRYRHCFEALGIVHSLSGPALESPTPRGVVMEVQNFRDYINDPKINGYQSLHTAVEIDGRLIRFQIRTPAMQSVAELGVFCNAYKSGRFEKPLFAWLDSAYIREFLRKDLDPATKLQLIYDLSRARQVNFKVLQNGSGEKAYSALLPGLSPIEVMMIVDPAAAVRLTAASSKSGRYYLTQPVRGRLPGGVHFVVGEEVQPLDYLDELLKSPLARHHYLKYIESIPPPERETFLREVLNGALEGKNGEAFRASFDPRAERYQDLFLTVADLEAEEAYLASAGLPTVPQILAAMATGETSAAAAVAKVTDLASARLKHPRHRTFKVTARTEGKTEEEMRVSISSRLARLFGYLDASRILRASGTPVGMEVWVPVYSPIQLRQLGHFTSFATNRHGITGISMAQADFPATYPDNVYPLAAIRLEEGNLFLDKGIARRVYTCLKYQPNPLVLFLLEESDSGRDPTSVPQFLAEATIIFLAAPGPTLIALAECFRREIEAKETHFVVIDTGTPLGSCMDERVLAAFLEPLTPEGRAPVQIVREPLTKKELERFLTSEAV
jgi:hypothetical protein